MHGCVDIGLGDTGVGRKAQGARDKKSQRVEKSTGQKVKTHSLTFLRRSCGGLRLFDFF